MMGQQDTSLSVLDPDLWRLITIKGGKIADGVNMLG